MCGGQIRDRATVIQQKTGRLVQFEVTDQTRAAIRDWLANTAAWNSQYLFPSRFHGHRTFRLDSTLGSWIAGSSATVSPARLTGLTRCGEPAQIYKKTGNLRAVQLLLGHTKLESTVGYLGIEVDDALSTRSKSSSNPAQVRPCLWRGRYQFI
jgi:integrase